MAAPAGVVELANKLAKLGYWADWDSEAALGAVREKYAGSDSLSKEQLKEVFLSLGYDKVKEVEEEEGGEEEGAGEGEENGEEGAQSREKPPRPPPEVSKFAEATFDILNSSGAESLSVFHILSTINICHNGFGETALRFALKCIDADSSGSLLEAQLWKAIVASSNANLDAIARNHLRRAWRNADRAAPPGSEEGEEAGEAVEESKGDEEGKTAAPVDPANVRIVIDSFVDKVTEDDRLATLLLKEVAVPIEEPKPEDEENLPPAEDD